MQKLILKPEQKEMWKTCYIIINGDELYPVVEDIEEEERGLTAENFKVYMFNADGVYVLTVEDFSFYNPDAGDYDYLYNEDGDYIDRCSVPIGVSIFLDDIIKARGNKT